jgi:hypothetical protein
MKTQTIASIMLKKSSLLGLNDSLQIMVLKEGWDKKEEMILQKPHLPAKPLEPTMLPV